MFFLRFILGILYFIADRYSEQRDRKARDWEGRWQAKSLRMNWKPGQLREGPEPYLCGMHAYQVSHRSLYYLYGRASLAKANVTESHGVSYTVSERLYRNAQQTSNN